ncbi:transcription-repair coupling factor [Haploplasma modicum]|uniref:transcription-repair coupling factor n=1 Tax=Haploplasma modicum TaxID=2150 RepID=UPI00138AD324|nr:transcription-repair coupling factor [Haploplasma modicum]
MKILNKEFKNILLNNEKYYYNSVDSYNIYLIKDLFYQKDETIFVVLPNLYEAQKYYDSLNLIMDEEDILFYPIDQTLTQVMSLGSPEFQSERLFTIRRLLRNKKSIVVTTLDGILMRQLKPIDYLNSNLVLEKNKEYDYNGIRDFLISSGYSFSYIVDMPGTFSIRGGIVDIYPRDNEGPFRLDFFDNYLESIKVFDPETQKSIAQVEKIEVSPLYELFYTTKMMDEAIKRIDKHFSNFKLSKKELQRFDEDMEKIALRKNLQTLNIYIPFFNEEETSVIDFVSNKQIIIIDKHKSEINEKQKIDDLQTFERTLDGKSFSSIPFYQNYLNMFARSDIFITNGKISEVGFDIGVLKTTEYFENLPLFYYDLINSYKNYEIIISINNDFYKKKLLEYFASKDFNDYSLTTEQIVGSFILNREKVIFINEESIFNFKSNRKAKYRSVLNQATKISNVDELNVGDYVVHYDFGIGKYMGLKTMDLSGGTKDYLYIMYKDDESLYVPIDQIDLVLKYSSEEGVIPKLSKMGSKQWDATKREVRKKIKELSDRLIKLYALREETIGYEFNADDNLQIEFENDFKYELTKDQETSIKKVKELMQRPKPMDLLIIGDVGFGKTEVALRAAFKAVLSGKQVLYLVPTTVLARQHYLTFKSRFEKFGAVVSLMSRFVSAKKQKETIDKLGKGLVDVVVGTHRLLSEDVKFSDLGLMVVDEEQRFGVMHKERIKEIKVNVDSLTLSATPIPRTLQMTMMGLKDLTTIETPPRNRYPVQTYVIPREDALVKEAIRREIARGGQVFYLYNKVVDIERIVLKIKDLVPEARITYAHGKMTKNKLEDTISDFIDHEYDVLVSTTIIETGIDIPNTNTLIIHDADKLGLSQLYQIRGRVGRSDKIAYAYLMHEANKDLNDEAYKRLKVLEEFTELGSGYKIALRDLSIRGAGDILGSEQSGFIDSVGFEMYMQLLNEVIHNKDELKVESENTNIYSKRTVDKEYIEEDSIRIEIHKQINKIQTTSELKELENELEDRFGKLSDELKEYMYEKLFKKLFYKIGGYKIINGRGSVRISVDKLSSKNIDGRKLFEVVNKSEYDLKLSYLNDEVGIELNYNNNKQHWLLTFSIIIEEYLSKIIM